MTENLTVIKEAQNKFEIIGKVIKNNLFMKKSRKGDNFIAGNVEIEVNKMINGEKTSNRFKVKPKFAKEITKAGAPNKIFIGFKTVMEEYKEGDIVRVTGHIDINEYYGEDDGNLRQFNVYEADFFNRLSQEEMEKSEPKAVASIETVIQEIVTDEEGNADVECFTVGWGGKMIPLQNVKIIDSKTTPVNIFAGMYYSGTTGMISYELDEYANKNAESTQELQEQGFGVMNDLAYVFDEKISQLRVTGATQPYGVDKEYSQEEIEKIIQKHEQDLEEERTKSNLQPQQGFGEVKAEELPTPEVAEGNPFGGANPFA